MNMDARLNNYLRANLEPIYYDALPQFHDKVRTGPNNYEPTWLAKISIQKLPGVALRLIEEFLNNLSIEERIEYINRSSDRGKNILFYCKDIKLMKIIIKYIRNINVCCDDGNNALTIICNRGDEEMIEMTELLLDNGIDINVKNKYGYTSLIYYCIVHSPTLMHPNDNFESNVELLIHRGADVLIKTHCGSQVFGYVQDVTLLSDYISQLLRGEICVRSVKSAANIGQNKN